MSNGKDVLENTESNDSNGNEKRGANVEGSDNVEKEAIEVGTDTAEQKLYETEPSTEAKTSQQLAVLTSKEAVELEKMRLFAREVAKSKSSNIKSEADAIMVMKRGHELGLSYGVSLNNIFAINGKTGMSVHLHKALLQKANVYFELLEDFVPVYSYGLQNDKGFIPMGKTTSRRVEGFTVHTKVIDYRTTYSFERKVRFGDEFRTKKVVMSYDYSEAEKAGLIDKEVWEKYTRSLMKARCFTLGSSEIASDVVQGMYGINELAMEFGHKFTINENLEETIVDVDHEVL